MLALLLHFIAVTRCKNSNPWHLDLSRPVAESSAPCLSDEEFDFAPFVDVSCKISRTISLEVSFESRPVDGRVLTCASEKSGMVISTLATCSESDALPRIVVLELKPEDSARFLIVLSCDEK